MLKWIIAGGALFWYLKSKDQCVVWQLIDKKAPTKPDPSWGTFPTREAAMAKAVNEGVPPALAGRYVICVRAR